MAVGNRLTKHARPLSTVMAVKGIPCDWGQIQRCLRAWQPDCLVVGLPTTLQGNAQYTTLAATTFSESLQARFHLPVHLVDERLSTVEARSQLFEAGGYRKLKKAEIDSISACIILEQWLRTEA